MPHRIFVAHSPVDRTAVAGLVRAMRALGYAVALDDQLPGGTSWWSTLLERIEQSEVFAYAVSGASLDSEACKAQHRYASSLGMPAIPVVVGEGVADALVPPELARLQRVDYRSASKQAMAELYRSIESLEAPALREAQAPAVPDGFEVDLPTAIRADYLDPEAQAAIVAQLERLVASGVTHPKLADALSTLRARNDLTVRADEKLAALAATAERAGRSAAPLASDSIRGEPADNRPGAGRVFLSYSRSDVEAVGVLAEDLRDAGFDVWLDRELPGGIEWWNEILRRIRESDAFVVAASAASRASRACAAELDYAEAVRRPVLRIAVESGEASGADLSYLDASADELAGVISALRGAHAPELPASLPASPPVPASYLFDTRTEIRTPRVLRPEEQMALVEQLAHHLEGDISPRDILRLTADLRGRDDLTVEAARALTTVEEAAQAAAARSGEAPERGQMAAPTEVEGAAGGAGGGKWASDRASGTPPEPAAAGDDEAAPPATMRPRRTGRRVAAAAGVLAVAVVGAGVVRPTLVDDDGNGSFTPPPSTTRTVASTPTPETTRQTASSTVVSSDVQGISGTVSFSWVVSGVTYAATLTTDGTTGLVDVGFFDSSTGLNSVIRQDVTLEQHDHGWAWVGSNPRFPDGSPAVFYSPDEFWLELRSGLWYVVNVCDAAGFCAPAA